MSWWEGSEKPYDLFAKSLTAEQHPSPKQPAPPPGQSVSRAELPPLHVFRIGDVVEFRTSRFVGGTGTIIAANNEFVIVQDDYGRHRVPHHGLLPSADDAP